jgi:molecular chaperone HscB
MNIADDDFLLFGLPQRYAIDLAELDARWRALQGKAHPDRFAAEGAASQRLAMQWAVRINQAYRRLRDPIQRGAYLCELRGAPIEAENNTAMPAAFLTHQLHWREALDDAHGESEVRALDDEVAAFEIETLGALQNQLDEQHDAAAAAQTVRALMFVSRFRASIDQRLEALEQ